MSKRPKPVASRAEGGPSKDPRAEIFTAGRSGRPGAPSSRPTGLGGTPGKAATPAPAPPAAAPAPTPKPPKPKPKAKPAKPADSSPAGHSRALAETMVDSFIDRLIGTAEAKGGMLSIEDLEAYSEEFLKKAEDLQVVIEKSFEDYARTRQRAAWEQVRNYPFDRLMIEKFSHLFDEDNLLQRDDSVSRRIMPGFLMAMNMMLGPEAIEEYQERCRRTVKRIRGDRDQDFDWAEVHADAEAKVVTLDAQVAIAFHFEDLERRAAWFIELINGHLPPVASGRNPDEAVWRFNEASFRRFLGALLAELKETLSSEGGRMRISRRHGVDACVALADIIKQIESYTA